MSLALGLEAGGWATLVERSNTSASSVLEHGANNLAVAGLASLARRCSVCLATFPSVWLLERHALLQHVGQANDEKPFICEQCGQRYRYRSAYVKHREQNHRARLPADKLFTCDVCGMQFRYLKSFKKHRLNHALERLQRGTDSASSSLTFISERAERNDQVSSTGEPPQLEFGNDAINVTVEDKNNKTLTGIVETVFDAVQVQNVHINSELTVDNHHGMNHDTNSDDPNNSIISNNLIVEDKKINDPTEGLLSVSRVHHDANKRERRFACPFCGKCVRSKENLKLHVRKHTGERPFVCLFCGRAFGGKSDLTRHLRIHTGERPYHCEMCGKCFARADYLSKHLTTHIHQR